MLFFVPAREVDDADDTIPLRLSTVEGTVKIRGVLGVLGLSKIWHGEPSCFCKHPERCDCYTAAPHKFRKPAGADPTENFEGSDVDSSVPEPEYVKLSEQIVGGYVIVIYEYDGRSDEVVVSVMHQRGCNQFNWPVPKDIVSYPAFNVRTLIAKPKKVGRHFRLEMSDWAKYQELLE